MSVKKIKNTIVVEGTIDKANTLIVNDKFIGDCRFILDILNKNDHYYYYINGKKKSLYEIMKLYEDSTPSNISRYKGLGEMNKDQLAESSLYPGSDRTLVRYTLEDIKEKDKKLKPKTRNILINNYANNPNTKKTVNSNKVQRKAHLSINNFNRIKSKNIVINEIF